MSESETLHYLVAGVLSLHDPCPHYVSVTPADWRLLYDAAPLPLRKSPFVMIWKGRSVCFKMSEFLPRGVVMVEGRSYYFAPSVGVTSMDGAE